MADIMKIEEIVEDFYQKRAKNIIDYIKKNVDKTNHVVKSLYFSLCSFIAFIFIIPIVTFEVINKWNNQNLFLYFAIFSICFIIWLILIYIFIKYSSFSTKSTPIEWFLSELKKIRAIKEFIFEDLHAIHWDLMISAEIITNKIKRNDSYEILYILRLHFKYPISYQNIILGTKKKDFIISLIKDFFEHIILLNKTCPYCKAPLDNLKQERCKYCFYQFKRHKANPR